MKCFQAVIAAACLAIVSTGVARAEIKAESVPASQAEDKPVTFSSRSQSVADTINQFTKETGIAIFLENFGNPDFGGPQITYDVDIKNLSSTEAVRELARSLSLGMLRDGDGTIRLSPNSWSSNENNRKDQPLVQLGFIRRSQSFPPNPQQQRDNLQLQFRIWSGKSPFNGPATIKLDEATDETGRSLLNTERRQDMYYGDDYGDRFVRDQGLTLQYPDPKPKKIASLTGSAVIAKPKTILRITADKLTDGPQKMDFMGGVLTIGPVKREGPGYTIKIGLTKGNIGNDNWRMMYSRVRSAQSGTVRGPDGQVLRLQNRGSSSGGKEVSADMYIMPPRQANGSDGEPIAPATFQWDVVTETVDDLLPFSLTNIDIP
jgi:hypothetical protein